MRKIKEVITGNTELKRDLGLAAAVAIVVGNCIGSGIFTSVASLAAASNPKTAIMAWIITAAGSLADCFELCQSGNRAAQNRGTDCLHQGCFW